MNNNSVYKDAARVSGLIYLFGVIEFLIFTVFLSFRRDILTGVLYGCTFASLSFFYLAYSVKKSVEKSEGGAKAHMAVSYNVRLVLTAVMIVVAARSEQIHFWAAIIPLLYQRPAVHIVDFINSHNKKGSENS